MLIPKATETARMYNYLPTRRNREYELAARHQSIFWDLQIARNWKQEAQLSQRGRAMLRVCQ